MSSIGNKRIHFLITSLARGGAPIQLISLVKQLHNQNWDIGVTTLLSPDAFVPQRAFLDELSEMGIRFYSLDMRRGIPEPQALFRFAGILRRERPMILHSHLVHANLLGRMVRIFAKVPVMISTAHNINEGGRWRELAYRVTDPLCDITTQVSKAGLDRYVEVKACPAHKIRFIPNGINTEQFKPNAEVRAVLRKELALKDCFVWLAVGRLEGAKDYPNMIQAFLRATKEFPNSLLLIVGYGSLREEVEKLVAELGLSGKVRFLGVGKDVPELMNAADAYVMSSAWEGMPMVLLEASAVGLPIVSTDVGGNKEVVIDGRSGFIVPPRKHEALTEGMLSVMNLSLEERVCMGKRGREHVELNFSLGKIVDLWVELYNELLENKGINL